MTDQHGCSVIEKHSTAQLFVAFSAAVAFASSSWLRRAIRKPLKTITYVAAPFFRVCMPISARVPAQTFFLEPMTVLFPEQVSCQILYYGGTEEDVTGSVLAFEPSKSYAAFEYRSGEIVPHRLRDRYECQNLLFVPSRLR